MVRMQTDPDPRLSRGETRRLRLWPLALAAILAFAGCASPSSPRGSQWTGPQTPAAVSSEPWDFNDKPARVLKTPHYLIHTTIDDEEVLDRLPQVMEGAYAQYQRFAQAPETSRPMKCYVFRRRGEWAAFTSRNTGSDAAIYLQITRGGYTIGDWFVSYYVGDNATFSVAAHEGWHQYVARHFKGRLPPFLEEGTACMFESVRFPGELPRWDLSLNPNRTFGLRKAIDNKVLFPLEKLCAMHAGDVVNLPGDKIEAFYAQNWAFARFLWEHNDGQYRQRFRKLLSDTAGGTLRDPGATMQRAAGTWSPSAGKPMLEHYLGKPGSEFEPEYLQFMRQIAYDSFNRQWMSRPN